MAARLLRRPHQRRRVTHSAAGRACPVFTVNSYKLTYVVDGEVYLEETVSYGSKVLHARA